MTRAATAAPTRYKIITAHDEEPISVEEARAHIEHRAYDDSDVDPTDDIMIEGWIKAAREYCESFTGLSLVHRTIEVAMDDFPTGEIVLPFPPLISVVNISAGTTSDDDLDPDTYNVDDYSRPARLLPVTSWPTVTASTNLVKIRFECGYGDDSDTYPLPYLLRAAMLLILGHLYANREDSTDKAMATIPTSADALMRPLRLRLGMA